MGLWRDIFGPDQDEVWGGIARQINATYTPSDWLKKGRIDLRGPNYIITLDTYSEMQGKYRHTYTRMRSPFRNTKHVGMNIYRETGFSWLGKLIGMSDIVIGDPLFDNEFIVQGRPESMVVAFLDDRKLRRMIKAQPDIAFKIRNDDGWFATQYPQGIDELHFLCRGYVKDEARLKRLFELFVASIDQLSAIGSGCQFGVNITPK